MNLQTTDTDLVSRGTFKPLALSQEPIYSAVVLESSLPHKKKVWILKNSLQQLKRLIATVSRTIPNSSRYYPTIEPSQPISARRYVIDVGVDIAFARAADFKSQQNIDDRNELAEEFHLLVDQWKQETFSYSSLTKQFAHPAYVRIMAMGKAGLPLVLEEMQKSQDNWFYALKFMAGTDGKDVAVGIKDFEEAKAAWLEWGYKNNYI